MSDRLVCFCYMSVCRTNAQAEQCRSSASKSVLHKKEKLESLYFLKKGCIFSLL